MGTKLPGDVRGRFHPAYYLSLRNNLAMTRQQGSKWLAESNAQASRLPTAWRCPHVHLLVERRPPPPPPRGIIVCLTCVPLFICINMDDDTTLTVTFYLAAAE